MTKTIATAKVQNDNRTETIYIEQRTNRRTGRPIFVVEYSQMGYLHTWDMQNTEKAARESANRLWLRLKGRETMIGCGAPAI